MKRVIYSNLSQLGKRHQKAARKIPGAVDKAFDVIADESIALYSKTTRTWKHQPKFSKKRTARGIMITTDDQIFNWVDQGTKPHVIQAKNAPFLVFGWPYKAATKPRVIGSFRAATGKNVARKLMVHHPGTLPRNFTDEIRKRMQKRAATIMRKEINAAINVEAVGL